jgi:phenylpyruvate tautomerase PptA (4-oxalocrotonate tautomerase family)
MPHVVVKLWPGKSEQQKAQLAWEITDCHVRSQLWGGISFGWV